MKGLAYLREWTSSVPANVVAICSSEPPPGVSRRALLGTYLRLRLRPGLAALSRSHRRIAAGLEPENVLGWRVRFANHAWLVFLVEEIFAHRVYDAGPLSPRPHIVDCGANIGVSVLFFKTVYPDATIIAFEPDADAYSLLERNVRENALSGVELHNAAVGATDGVIELYASSDDPASPRAGQQERPDLTEVHRVPMVRLSPLLGEPALVKLDIEGAERDVIDELVDSGAIRRIGQLLIEYHHHVKDGDDALGHLLGSLEEVGFGYQLLTFNRPPMPFRRDEYQEVMIRAYRR
jgi:FkbM family methyltransferase